MTPAGWSDEVFLRTVHRWSNLHGSVHGWPNHEVGHAGGGTVWGSYLWPASSPHLVVEDIADVPGLTPVADAWRAGHRHATRHGYATGMLTFEASHNPAGPIFGLVSIRASAGLVFEDIARSDLGSPSFSDPGAVIQAVDRWAHDTGYLAGFPTFEQGVTNGRVVYGAFMVPHGGPSGIVHRDIPEPELLALGPAAPPSPPDLHTALVSLFYTENDGKHIGVWVGSTAAGDADAPITAMRVGSIPGWTTTWRIDVSHEVGGRTTEARLVPGVPAHDFDGQTAVGTWVISLSAVGVDRHAPLSLTATTA